MELIKSKFAIIVAIFGLLVVGFSIYQWNYAFKDMSQFFFGTMIGFGFIVWARELWNKARAYYEDKEWKENHLSYHEDLTRHLNSIDSEIQEVRQIGNDFKLSEIETKY